MAVDSGAAGLDHVCKVVVLVRVEELLLLLHFTLQDHGLHGLLRLPLLPAADGRQEWLEVGVEVFGGDSEVPVEEEEELLLHEVDLTVGEAKVWEPGHSGVARPVLVLW